MTCDQAAEQMSGALDGELSPEERQALEDHLAECPECRCLWEELRGLEDLLSDAPLEVPENFHASVMAAVADCPVSHAPTPRKRPMWKAWAGLAAVAAIAVLAVGPSLMPGMGGAGGTSEAALPAVVSNGAAPSDALDSAVDGRSADAMPESQETLTDHSAPTEDTDAGQPETQSAPEPSEPPAAVFYNSGTPEETPAPAVNDSETSTEPESGNAKTPGENRTEPASGEAAPEPEPSQFLLEQEPPRLSSVPYAAVLSVDGALPEGYAWSAEDSLEVDGQVLSELLAALDEAGVSYTWEQGTPEEAAEGVVLLIRADTGEAE